MMMVYEHISYYTITFYAAVRQVSHAKEFSNLVT